MRGENEGACGTTPCGAGNIPACAGKTSVEPSSRNANQEHPRVRGENMKTDMERLNLEGTSPRARGKHEFDRVGVVGDRNIPACAGKTSPAFISMQPAGEHPRVRGENWTILQIAASWCRNIPACAGKTPPGGSTGDTGGGTSPRARGKPTCLAMACAVSKEHPRVRGENHSPGAAIVAV